MRVAFMGTPDFSVPALKALAEAGHEIVRVYTQPPAPAGRGKKERPSAVEQAARAMGLEVATPKSFKDASVIADFCALGLDAALVVAYGQILPQAALDGPRLGCWNLHASLLPRWRGAAPIQRAIMAGDSETGAGFMQMEAGLDTGGVLLEARCPIASTDTAASLHDTLASLAAGLVAPAFEKLAAGDTAVTPQPEAGVTYAAKILKDEARIAWDISAEEIDRRVRGLCPFPGAWTEIDGERVKILAGVVEEAQATGSAEAGTMLDDSLSVQTGRGVYRITQAQRAGARAMQADEFLRGFPVAKGVRAR